MKKKFTLVSYKSTYLYLKPSYSSARRSELVGKLFQGLNFIAGMLLLVARDEEKVFWLMDTLINHILKDYYCPSLVGAKADIEVLEALVRYRNQSRHLSAPVRVPVHAD